MPVPSPKTRRKVRLCKLRNNPDLYLLMMPGKETHRVIKSLGTFYTPV